MVRQPHVRALIDEKTRGALDTGKMLAAGRMLELCRAESEHVSFDASKHVLAIGGIAPPSDNRGVNISISNNVSAGYVVDLTPWQPVSDESRPAKVITLLPEAANE